MKRISIPQMGKVFLAIMLSLLIVSCSSTRKDCHGAKKHRQSNGAFL